MMKILYKIMLLFTLFMTLSFSKEDIAGIVSVEMYDKIYVEAISDTQSATFKDVNVSLSLLKTSDDSLSIDTIEEHVNAFVPLTKEELFRDKNVNYWVRCDLGENFPKGRFIYSYGNFDFVENSFTSKQNLEKFDLAKIHRFIFTYNPLQDASVYYFKLVPSSSNYGLRFVQVSTSKSFYEELDAWYAVLFIVAGIIGVILMASAYNGAMYFYNRDKSFLYYALMQFFIVLSLTHMTGVLDFVDGAFTQNEIYPTIIGLISILFTILFTQSFLNTKQYTPRIHVFLIGATLMILLDIGLSFFMTSYVLHYNLLPFFILSYFIAGIIRLRQGFKPAKFYLWGWSFIIFFLFVDVFLLKNFIISPIFFGVLAEALFLALAVSFKVKMIADERTEQKELMVHQSKLASMGEMLGNIAHQWRQPLTHLSYTLINIEEAQTHGELDEVYLKKKIDESHRQLRFMSDTIEGFQEFYKPNREKEEFSLAKASEETLEIMSSILEKNEIEVKLVVHNDTWVFNHKNEYKQVLLNLMSNAKDALLSRGVISPKIIITIDDKSVWVEDTAGGVNKKILQRICEPYFTTKEGNTGIGLYMSKMIVEKKMGAMLSIENSKNGLKVLISFQESSKK